ncbi:acyltransferase [Clostridium perfringens]|nr:acyltransferase [Clostridium perfringens]
MSKLFKFLRMPFAIKIETLRRLLWFLKFFRYGYFGKNSIITSPMIIYNKKNIFIDDFVTIRWNIRIEPIKRWRNQKFNPKIKIGKHTNIEQNCHIICANSVEIGEYVTIAGYSFITDVDHEYMEIDRGVLNQPLIVKETIIGDESFIGMGSRIMAGVNIGRHCIIGSNSVVNKNIPDYSVAVGVPAKIVKRYDFERKEWVKTNSKGEFLN